MSSSDETSSHSGAPQEAPQAALSAEAPPVVLKESPRIQALLDREIVFPSSRRLLDSGARFRELRRRAAVQRRRITLWEIIWFLPRKIRQFLSSLTQPGLFVATFVLLVAFGTAGLWAFPEIFLKGGASMPLSFVDALFTMISAASLTGLSAFDLGSRMTFLGEAWTLLFIQAGGLTFYAFSTLLICAVGQRLSATGGDLFAASLFAANQGRSSGQMLRRLVRFTLISEAIGALLLSPFMIMAEPLSLKGIGRGLWNAVFLSVASFCNSSLSLKADSLQSFARNPFVLGIVTLLSILGGVGFLVLLELRRWWVVRQKALEADGTGGLLPGEMAAAEREKLSLNALIAAVATPILLVAGTLMFLTFEWSGALQSFGPIDRLMNAWTLSAMNRSAGMSSVDPSAISNAGIYLSILMMFIGGASGSMAGGLKVTTFAVLVAQAISKIRGHHYVGLFGRAVPDRAVERAGTLALISLFLVSFALFLLGWTESGSALDVASSRRNFLPMFYEAVSALTNTGISLNFTQTLSDMGKMVIAALMVIGRIGFLAFFTAVSLREKPGEGEFRPAVEDVFLG